MHDVRPIECDRTRQFVSVSLDERLSAFERALVMSHLDVCEPCRLYEASARHVTTTLRAAPPEWLATPVQPPTRASLAWRSVATVAGIGAAAAVALLAFVGFATAPDRSEWRADGVLVASALEPEGTNDPLVLRPGSLARDRGAIAYGAGGIGSYKPPLQADG